MTRVAVNLLWCVPQVVGGSEQYLTRQLLALTDEFSPEARHFDVLAMVPRGFVAVHPELAGRVEMVTGPVDGVRRELRVVAESTWLPRAVRRSGAQLVHHGGGTLPSIGAGRPTVLTIHDVQFRTYPASFSPNKLAYLQAVVPRSIRRADVVTTPSVFVRNTVCELGARSDRVVVVPHPMPAPEVMVRSNPDELRARYGLSGPFVVYPAITYAHKNHVVLVRAMAELAARWPELRLVLIGGEGPQEHQVRDEARRLGVSAAVVRPGRVSDADRNGLLAIADALVFPSRYEGFGAPVVEAMHLGCPVIASRAAALPEVVGDAGVLVDPDDVAGWAAAIDRLVGDRVERLRLLAAAALRVGEFDGRSTSRRLAEAYGLALR